MAKALVFAIAFIVTLFVLAVLVTAASVEPALGDEEGDVERVTAAAPVAQPQCGTERWSTKIGTDAAAASINFDGVPVMTTVEDLRSRPAPKDIRHFVGRSSGIEDRLFAIDATLVLFKSEADGDLHLVLEGASGETMIAEIPSPRCVPATSPFYAGVSSTRATFEARFHTKAEGHIRVPVRVMGVGFFDFIHGQTGVAPNGIEIHPVLSINFTEPQSSSKGARP
jgi:hypothetical protein